MKKISPVTQLPRTLYKQIHANVPIPCVDVVLLDGKKVLLGLRTNPPAKGSYWFPGGRVYKGETLKDAAIRKMKEETGLTVSIIAHLGSDETIFPDSIFGWPTHSINNLFLVRAKKKQLITGDNQHSDWQWFETLPAKSHPYIKKFYQRALEVSNLNTKGT